MYGNIGDVTTTHHHLLPSSSSAGNPNSTYPLLHHQLHQTMMIPLPPPFDDEFPTRDERLPPWSNQETRDLIEMRAQVELAAKTNSTINLWEMVADRMRDRGYRRTADRCKWKWKNLVAAYKVFCIITFNLFYMCVHALVFCDYFLIFGMVELVILHLFCVCERDYVGIHPFPFQRVSLF